jgi:SAM-dependent MidA family methyltransferase
MHDSATDSQNRTTPQVAMKSVAEKIRAEFNACGTVSFARFMQLALYCPDCGFYEKESDTVGRHGDFYTNVTVGSLFGGLLAFQFAAWLDEIKGQNSVLKIVEAGAHSGQLARDVLRWLGARRPDLYESLEFRIVEPSRRLRARQERRLHEFSEKIQWAGTIAEVGVIDGVIYSNELLDAMPVRRFGWDAKAREWFEWGVAEEQGRFV